MQDEVERERDIARLGYLMSEASEAMCSATWLHGLEDTLPPLVVGAVLKNEPIMGWGDWADLNDCREMVRLAIKLGHWVKWVDIESYAPYQPKGLELDMLAVAAHLED